MTNNKNEIVSDVTDNKTNTKESGMLKRVLAIIGVVLLVGMYVTTFIFAITDNPNTMNLFWASLFLTAVVPAMIYVIFMVRRVIQSYTK